MQMPIKAVLIGAGQRGALDYAPYALQHPKELKFIAVAEPKCERRHSFSKKHNIRSENQFESWEELLELPQMADAALICTQDQMHTAPTLAALEKGYHVLLEKPMATTAIACKKLLDASIENERQLHICHVLRYTKHFQKLREIVNQGELGQIIHIEHRENVSWWHMAHSYVRGNWAVEAESCPMILAKCCHDFDILMWILGRKCIHLSSTGNLIHFRPENAPAGVPERCLDNCPAKESCVYYAPFIYIDSSPLWRMIESTSNGLIKYIMRMQRLFPQILNAASRLIPTLKQVSDYQGWPRSVLTEEPSTENISTALETGPYGRCVYQCGNDAVDHQVVSMEFEDGISVTLTVHGHAAIEGRTTFIAGSLGNLHASFGLGGSWIEFVEHRSGKSTRYDTSSTITSGHSGGDEGIMRSFVQSLRENKFEETRTTTQEAVESHILAFAAEEARQKGTIISIKDRC